MQTSIVAQSSYLFHQSSNVTFQGSSCQLIAQSRGRSIFSCAVFNVLIAIHPSSTAVIVAALQTGFSMLDLALMSCRRLVETPVLTHFVIPVENKATKTRQNHNSMVICGGTSGF